MEKKLQDYIHFYFGQPCVNSWFLETHEAYDDGWKLTGIVAAFKERPYYLENEKDFIRTQEVKLLLRPLSDITDTEVLAGAEILGGVSHYSKESQIGQFKDLMERISNMQTNIAGEKWMNLTIYLLSLGFDLFDLIPAGLALDKTKRLSESKEGRDDPGQPIHSHQ